MGGRGREGREQTGITRMRLCGLYAYQDINISRNAFLLLQKLAGTGLAMKIWSEIGNGFIDKVVCLSSFFSTETKYQISYGAF